MCPHTPHRCPRTYTSMNFTHICVYYVRTCAGSCVRSEEPEKPKSLPESPPPPVTAPPPPPTPPPPPRPSALLSPVTTLPPPLSRGPTPGRSKIVDGRRGGSPRVACPLPLIRTCVMFRSPSPCRLSLSLASRPASVYMHLFRVLICARVCLINL